MGVEHTIYCDGCSTILVSASSVTKARREGRRDKIVFRRGDKDLCQECNQRAASTQKGNKVK
jgi:hypothetical protein